MILLHRLLMTAAVMTSLLVASTTGQIDKASFILRMPPSIEEGPESNYEGYKHVFRSDTVIKLPCKATGKPKPEYVTSSLQSFTLDEGYYQCFANNAFGRALSNIVHLQMAKLGSFPAQAPKTNYNVKLGESVSVICKDDYQSVPPPTFSWHRGQSVTDEKPKRLMQDRRILLDEEGTLHFVYVTAADQTNGQEVYKCRVFNKILDQSAGGSYSTIRVDSSSPPHDRRPSIMYKSQVKGRPGEPIIGLLRGELRLRCYFSAKPTPDIEWRRAGGKYLDMVRSKSQNYRTELLLTDLREEDAGTYQCRGKNALGNSQWESIKVIIQARPTFLPNSRPTNVNATDGETVTFRCDAHAIPPADVQWLINGAAPADNPRYKFLDSGKTLRIQNVCKDCPTRNSDLMNIQCNISNVHGYSFADGYLNVLLPTVIHVAPQNLTLGVDDREARFRCEASSDDSTPITITWRRDGEKIVYGDAYVLEADNTLLIKTGSDPQAFKATYTCEASNSYSKQQRSADLFVSETEPVQPVIRAASFQLWWIFVIVAIVLLILILLLCCCLCTQRNKGDTYPVDEKERANGNDPERELKDSGFMDYQRPEEKPLKGSRASLTSSINLNSDDEGSLAEYGEIDAGKFTEDGSFIGQYATNERRKRKTESHV